MAAVEADRLLAGLDWDRLAPRPLGAYRRVRVAALGKAALATCSVVEAALGDRLSGGVCVVPHGYPASLPARFAPLRRVALREAGHPVPDAASSRAGRALLAEARRCRPGDLLVVLLSGGGSALALAPAPGLALADVQAAARLLLGAGAPIDAVNAVRKHLGRVGGGRLAEAAQGDVLTLALSDVPGDDPAVIASGPTVPDPSTFEEACEVLHTYGVWAAVPPAVRAFLEAGQGGRHPETPGPGDPAFARTTYRLIGSNATARAAALAAARESGLAGEEGPPLAGEAREVGRQWGLWLRAAPPGTCRVAGGETTVTLRGDGLGGRSQELALAAALALDGAATPAALLAAGTDGVDGPTDAAGAVADARTAGGTVARARRRGLDAAAALARNDSHTFFRGAGGLVQTGPTHTNVMDLVVAVVLREGA